jgi:hypothetical protein
MNGNFLKRVFACPSFPDDYRAFLHELPDLIIQDNHKKVLYLEDLIQKALSSNDLNVSFHLYLENRCHKASALDKRDSKPDTATRSKSSGLRQLSSWYPPKSRGQIWKEGAETVMEIGEWLLERG